VDRIRTALAWVLAWQLLVTPQVGLAATVSGTVTREGAESTSLEGSQVSSASSSSAAGSTLVFERGATGIADGSGPAAALGSASPTGAARYEVPILVPPGTGGMQPSLSLAYSSHSATSGSWVGAGWSLSGLGAVTRSLEEGVPTYDDQIDVFLLNGQELVPDDTIADRFHTERETFVRIDYDPVGDAWEVRSKDGTLTRFGGSGCEIDGPSGTFAWLLCSREDPNGNAFTVSYDDQTDPGTAYPSEIRYTLRGDGGGGFQSLDGDPSKDRVIQFQLEATPRPDPTERYSAGFQQVETRRLELIDVSFADGSLLRRYALSYELSPETQRTRLGAVTLYGTDGNQEPPPATPFVWTFGYRSVSKGWALVDNGDWTVPDGVFFVRQDAQDGGTRVADMNGDGLDDLVREVKIGASYTNDTDSGVYLNDGTGFLDNDDPESDAWRFEQTNPDFSNLPAYFERVSGWQDPEFVHVVDGKVLSRSTVATDLNRDGRADLLIAQSYFFPTGVPDQFGFTLHFARFERDPETFAWVERTPFHLGEGPFHFWGMSFEIADSSGSRETATGLSALAELNGDGRPDLVTRGWLDGIASENWWMFNLAPEDDPDSYGYGSVIETGGYKICTMDPQGPGDTCLRNAAIGRLDMYLEPARFEFAQRFGVRMLDVNGDGLQDHITSMASRRGLVECTSQLECSFDDVCASVSGPPGTPQEACLQDCAFESTPCRLGTSCNQLCRPLERMRAYLNDGFGFASSNSAWLPPVYFDIPFQDDAVDAAVRFADVNADGRTDLVLHASSYSQKLWIGGLKEAAYPST